MRVRDTRIYVCSKGHLVKAESSVISFDSICPTCKANERRRATKVANRVARRTAALRSGRQA